MLAGATLSLSLLPTPLRASLYPKVRLIYTPHCLGSLAGIIFFGSPLLDAGSGVSFCFFSFGARMDAVWKPVQREVSQAPALLRGFI